MGLDSWEGVIYTGPVDTYFKEIGYCKLEPLEYRSIDFKIERFPGIKYFQPNSVVNYPGLDFPFTRIVEYKHFFNQNVGDYTIIVSETTSDHGEPYYPVPNERNQVLYEEYRKMAKGLEENGIYFVGRLATYKYYNMDGAIRAALDLFNRLDDAK